MNALTLGTSAIRQIDGLYSLNDLHKSSGGEAKHRPNYFLELQQTKELTAEIQIAGIPAISAKPRVGTYVCKELVIAYAAWISAAFHLKVIRVFLDQQAAVLPAPTSEETLTPSEAQTLHEVIDRKAAGCGTWKSKAYPEIYTRLQNKFRATSYKLIQRSQLADAILYVTEMELHGAPKALPARIPVRKIGDLSFFCKSGRPRTHLHNQPGTAGTWWDYPQHLKDLPWSDGLKVGRGFFAEVAELAEHDEHAAYLVLESVLGIAWPLPAGNPQKNSCIEHGFAQAMAVAMMTGLRAVRGGAPAYAWGV